MITPYRAESEEDRQGRPPQNYRIEHPLKPKRAAMAAAAEAPGALLPPKRRLYEHMPAHLVRAYVGEEMWRSYFKFAFDRNPWDRQISWYFYKTKSKAARPSFERFMASRRRAYVDNHEIYMDDGALAVDFLGRYESLDADLAKALELAGVGGASRCRRRTSPRTRASARTTAAITRPRPKRWWPTGTRRRSSCSDYGF